jgi:hypothetical protein
MQAAEAKDGRRAAARGAKSGAGATSPAASPWRVCSTGSLQKQMSCHWKLSARMFSLLDPSWAGHTNELSRDILGGVRDCAGWSRNWCAQEWSMRRAGLTWADLLMEECSRLCSILIESLHRAFPHMLNFGSREVFGADVSADDSRSSMPSGSPCNNAHEGAQCR